MADPLSVAGSIAGLISLGDVVFRKLYHYARSVKNAEQEISVLRDETAALNGVLHNLRLIADDLEATTSLNHSIRPDHVNSCIATIQKLHDQLAAIELPENNKTRRIIRKLVWPVKATGVQEFISAIRQHRNTLSIALSADSMAALLKCLSLQETISKQISDVEATLRKKQEIDTRVVLDAERQTVLDHFLSVNPQPKLQDSVKERYPTTGFWLTEDETFCKWMRDSGTHLWLKGIPGAGKTVLSGLVIEECLRRMTAERAVAFFYCDYRDSKSQNVSDVLGTIASQIARQNEASFQLLKAYYSNLRPLHQLKRSPKDSELKDLIRTMTTKFEDVRIVVDGLDECGDSGSQLAQALMSVASSQTTISLAIFSRDEADIRYVLSPPSCELVDIAAQSRDLDHYVRSVLEQRINDKRLRLRSVQLKEQIVNRLVSEAQGMFRWVSCQLDHLCELPTDRDRRLALDKLPVSLHATYSRVLERITDIRSIFLVKKSLQWLAYASPPPSLDALVEVLALEDDDDNIDPEAYPDPEDVVRFCGSLVRRVGDCLELAHFTVLQFLEAIDICHDHLANFRIAANDANELLKLGIRYVSFSTFDIPPPSELADFVHRLEEHPFHGYISTNLVKFLGPDRVDEESFELLRHLFDPEKSFNFINFMLEYLIHWPASQRPSGHAQYDKSELQRIRRLVSHVDFTPLHGAALLQLDEICCWIIDKGSDVNVMSPAGTPLECAVFGPSWILRKELDPEFLHHHNSQDTIMALLSRGADSSVNSDDEVSLSLAAICGPVHSSSPFAELIKNGMPLQDDAIGHIATFRAEIFEQVFDFLNGVQDLQIGSTAKTKLLGLAQEMGSSGEAMEPAPPSSPTDEGFIEGIMYAIEFDLHIQFNEYARDPRFTVDMADNEDGTLLHLAVSYNATRIVHVLLDLGYDVNELTNVLKFTPLHVAMANKCDDAEILESLFNSYSAHHIDEMGRSVWHIGSYFGSYYALEFLLKKLGATHPALRTEDKEGYTPILLAAKKGHSDCAKLLLKVLCSDHTIFSDGAIHLYAVREGMFDVLEQIADLGFETWSQKFCMIYKGQAYFDVDLLHCSIHEENVEMVKKLLETGYFEDLDSPTFRGLNYLHHAAFEGPLDAVRWLIDKGADLNAVTTILRDTALHLSMRRGRFQHAMALLEAGALLQKNAEGKYPHDTIPQRARARFYKLWSKSKIPIPPHALEQLKDGPSDITAEFFEAIIEGDLERCCAATFGIQELPYHFPNCGGCTPLIVAISRKEYEIVEFLLSRKAYPAGSVCRRFRDRKAPYLSSALDLMISIPTLNSKINQLLDLCLHVDDHWIHHQLQPFHVAAIHNPEAINVLVTYFRANKSDLLKWLPQRTSWVGRRDSDIVHRLLEMQWRPPFYDVDATKLSGSTPLHLAAYYGKPYAVERLLHYGANPNSLNDRNMTPLHCAVLSDSLACASLLLQHGATRQLIDFRRRTPLMIACRSGSIEMLNLLMQPQFDTDMADEFGRTALHIAAKQGEIDVFATLVKAGWDPYRRDSIGFTPIRFACGQPNIATYVFASRLDITHLVAGTQQDARPLRNVATASLMKKILRSVEKSTRQQFLATDKGADLCTHAAFTSLGMLTTLIEAGADIERPARNYSSVLMSACMAGWLPTISFLVRRGARLESTLNGHPINVIQAAANHKHVIEWFLVDRYTDQFKLEERGWNGHDPSKPIVAWSGIRQVQIPLKGRFIRPRDISLEEHARDLRINRDKWLVMVPLGWNTVAHFTPTIEELRVA